MFSFLKSKAAPIPAVPEPQPPEVDPYELLDEQQIQIDALNKAIGLLDAQAKLNYHNAMITIGCLLSTLGGSVVLSNTLVEAMGDALFDVDVKKVEGGLEVSLVDLSSSEANCEE